MTITFSGSLIHTDSKKNIHHHFYLSQNTTQLHITLDYSPHKTDGADYPNQMSLSLFDPNGSRGARHNNADQTIRLNAVFASPGYIAGELPAGEWTVVLDTHRILPPNPVTYTISITLSSEPITDVHIDYPKGKTASRGQGWYRGDLHGHTLHSDGDWDVPDFVQYGRDFKLDFVTLTDHNTVSALAQVDSLSADDLLTMGGMELTTYHGHALALGTRQWYEWRNINGNNMHDLAQAVIDSGAYYVIAHPQSPGDPSCTGCRWEFKEMMPGISPAVEVWNGPWRDYNEDSLQLYYEWLNEGHKLVATAGTDIHGQPPQTDDPLRVGFNVVYADDLTEVDILNAVRQGHLYLSAEPKMTLTATSDDIQVMMGDTIEATGEIQLSATWDNTNEHDLIRLISNGELADEFKATESNEKTWVIGSETKWGLVEIRDINYQLRAITNPIWIQ